MDATIDSLNIEIQSNVEQSNTAIDTLIKKFKDLQTEITNTIKQASDLSKLKADISSAKVSSSVKTSKAKTTPVSQTETDLANMKEAVKYDDSKFKEFSTLITATKDATKATTTYKNEMGDLFRTTETTKNGITSYSVSLKQNANQSKSLSETLSSVSTGMDKFKAKVVAGVASLVALVKVIGNAVQESSKYNESLNLFMVTMGDYAKEGMEWVNKFSDALYLDPANVMQYMGSFNSLVKGLGVGAENSYKMSKNLTQLTFDLSSFKNISIESAYEKLMSGISGEIEPLILAAIICEYYRKRGELVNTRCGY